MQQDRYRSVALPLDDDVLEIREYSAEGARRGVVLVGGIGGGWDSPARSLYPRLAEQLQDMGIAAARVHFRDPRHLEKATRDVLRVLEHLTDQGVRAAAVVGHSFGGAVAIRAALLGDVACVVTLATQNQGAQNVADLPAATALLLIHGERDPILRPSASEDLHRRAHHPKRLVLIPDAGHGLDEAAEQVYGETLAWIVAHLRP